MAAGLLPALRPLFFLTAAPPLRLLRSRDGDPVPDQQVMSGPSSARRYGRDNHYDTRWLRTSRDPPFGGSVLEALINCLASLLQPPTVGENMAGRVAEPGAPTDQLRRWIADRAL